MATVMLTGSSGQVGRAVRPVLEMAGWTVVPFDLRDGDDLRDSVAVRRAMRGCDAVVHAGALAHDTATESLGWHATRSWPNEEQRGAGSDVSP